MSLAFRKPVKGEARAEKLAKRANCLICDKPRPVGPRGWNTRPACPGRCSQILSERRHRPCLWCRVYFKPGLSQRYLYCSRECYRKYVGQRERFVLMTCHRCGAQKRRTAAAIKRVKLTFCSRACRDQHYSGSNSPIYRGDCDPNRGQKWRRIAETVRERDGRVCRRCGKTEAENKSKLAVDHIRPWRSFTDKNEANATSNLVSLCMSCHSFKTLHVERRWLRGDRVELAKWLTSLGVEWTGPAIPHADQGPRSLHSHDLRAVPLTADLGDGPVRFDRAEEGGWRTVGVS